jgi:hypothetical protein
LQEDKLETLENQETLISAFWNIVDTGMQAQGFYYGLPLGIGETQITTYSPQLQEIIDVVSKQMPAADSIEDIEDVEEDQWLGHAMWYTSRQWRGNFGFVVIGKHAKTGKVRKQFMIQNPEIRRLGYIIESAGMRMSYSLFEAEAKAQKRLSEALTEIQSKSYFLTGEFIQRGRSGVAYLIRKNRPTLALRDDNGKSPARPLCALCMHPLAYYNDTWAGVMAPSDEVLSHLLMIRSDEHYFWRKANQISPDNPVSGI